MLCEGRVVLDRCMEMDAITYGISPYFGPLAQTRDNTYSEGFSALSTLSPVRQKENCREGGGDKQVFRRRKFGGFFFPYIRVVVCKRSPPLPPAVSFHPRRCFGFIFVRLGGHRLGHPHRESHLLSIRKRVESVAERRSCQRKRVRGGKSIVRPAHREKKSSVFRLTIFHFFFSFLFGEACAGTHPAGSAPGTRER